MANRFVQKLSRLADLTTCDVAALENATGWGRHYASRQDLIREGDESGPVFVMLEGWAYRNKILPNAGEILQCHNRSRLLRKAMLGGSRCVGVGGERGEQPPSLRPVPPCWRVAGGYRRRPPW